MRGDERVRRLANSVAPSSFQGEGWGEGSSRVLAHTASGRRGRSVSCRAIRIATGPATGGSGQGGNYIATSDGGSDGGCPPDYPDGSCTTTYQSLDSGATWQFSVDEEHLAILVEGVRAPGDFSGDSDVDLNDFAAFDNCVTGPGETANVSCRVFDFDNDEDVDFTDFQVMQIVFAWE